MNPKTIFQKLGALVMLLILLPASAAGFSYEDIKYNIISEQDRTVAVVGTDNQYLSNISIPDKAICSGKTYRVIAIGEGAFVKHNSLTSVIIGNSITTIGDNAFAKCHVLTSVTIGNSVTKIGSNAFYDCIALKSVSIGNSVTTIGGGAFCECIALTSVTIPNSVTKIGSNAFRKCTALTSVTIPVSVTTIEGWAFFRCDALTSVTIPSSVTTVGSAAFSSCSQLEYIDVDSGNLNYLSFEGILYDKDKTTLISCPGAKINVIIPNSVTTIPICAFENCAALKSLTIGNSVTSIWESFHGCKGLTSVYNLSKIPLECKPDFPDEALRNATLYVPTGTLEAYQKVDPWRNFWNIEETDFSGIEDIELDKTNVRVSVNDGFVTFDGLTCGEEIFVYDMQGKVVYHGTETSISKLTSGVYIVKVGGETIKFVI